MERKIATIIFGFLSIFFFSLNPAHAASNGLLDGLKSYNLGGNGAATDNNISTGIYTKQPGECYLLNTCGITYALASVQNIRMIYVQKSSSGYSIYFYNSAKSIVASFSSTANGYFPVVANSVKYIEFRASNGTTLYEFDAFLRSDYTPPGNVRNLVESHTDTTIKLDWENPDDVDFSHLKVFKNNELIYDMYTDNKAVFNDLEPDTEYTFIIQSVDTSTNVSDGAIINVRTNPTPIPPPPEVSGLYSQSHFDRVNLNWDNPDHPSFDHVKIYRDDLIAQDSNMIKEYFIGKSVSASGYKPMFETNGTYWSDLTVSSDTDYEYLLTTVSGTGNESGGVAIMVTTPPEPLPEMGGEEITKDVNGDFKVNWTSPTTGKVKILVDGKEYKTVDASLKEYVIPAADMAYDLLGKPKVQLVAISDSGKEGTPTKPPVNSGGGGGTVGVTLPESFNVNSFLKTVMSLIALVGPFILLAIVIRFPPRIIAFLKGVIAKYKEGKLRL